MYKRPPRYHPRNKPLRRKSQRWRDGRYSLPKIWKRVAPLQKEKTRVALEMACQNKAREMRYKAPRISHIISGLLLSLYLYTEDPERVGDKFNIFLFPEIYLSEISEATIVARRWDTTLESSNLMKFVDTANLIQIQKVTPIIGW